MRLSAALPAAATLPAAAAILALAGPPVSGATAEGFLGGAEFETRVTGQTLTYSQDGRIYGIEQYLPGRRVRWRFADDECLYGRWFEKEAGLICFVYEYDPDEHCWHFRDGGGRLTALSVDDAPGTALSEVAQSPAGLSCPGPGLGV